MMDYRGIGDQFEAIWTLAKIGIAAIAIVALAGLCALGFGIFKLIQWAF